MLQSRDARQRSKEALEAVKQSTRPFVCQFCKRSYVKQASLTRHLPQCHDNHVSKMRLYRRAFPSYEMWFREAKRTVPDFDTFCDSRFGGYFCKFILWCDAMNVASPTTYTRIMLAETLHPSVWDDVSSYKLYIQQFDQYITTDEWLIATVGTIERNCAAKRIGRSQFYQMTTPNELIHLIRTKSVYPRYLICDPLFQSYLSSLPDIIAKMIGEAIDDRFTQGSDPCDPTIMQVIQHVNS